MKLSLSKKRRRGERSVATGHFNLWAWFSCAGYAMFQNKLRASSYEPSNRAGPVSRTNFVFCSYGKFQPGYRAEISAVTEMNKAPTFKFHPGNRAGVFIWENFQFGYRDLGRKNRELGNRASPSSHMNTLKFLQRKER